MKSLPTIVCVHIIQSAHSPAEIYVADPTSSLQGRPPLLVNSSQAKNGRRPSDSKEKMYSQGSTVQLVNVSLVRWLKQDNEERLYLCNWQDSRLFHK